MPTLELWTLEPSSALGDEGVRMIGGEGEAGLGDEGVRMTGGEGEAGLDGE